jgi:hypothetical protein
MSRWTGTFTASANNSEGRATLASIRAREPARQFIGKRSVCSRETVLVTGNKRAAIDVVSVSRQ